ncbi:hypothetical protein [Pseudomonas sp. NMI795_08]|uniref:hypothetical protein n=1 Tax=Pseudomonas sp. NMI795_08 TaxID=2903144 RepID=UPI001E401714|nr:hypothetical protein [Pseudomonas sp. NMI795_08]MCE1119084.1 hypothetical protein [Pseudomonas sp. NMI795_08]MCE1119098.1 hypothetical protein [Pseudomonas sp. NMI795_08]
MSAREYQFALDCLSDDLIKFHDDWNWVATDIHCRACGGRQPLADAGVPFRHTVEDCPNQRDFVRYPWEELRRALDHLPALIRHTPRGGA